MVDSAGFPFTADFHHQGFGPAQYFPGKENITIKCTTLNVFYQYQLLYLSLGLCLNKHLWLQYTAVLRQRKSRINWNYTKTDMKNFDPLASYPPRNVHKPFLLAMQKIAACCPIVTMEVGEGWR